MKIENIVIQDYMGIYVLENEYINSFNLTEEEKNTIYNNAIFELKKDTCIEEFYQLVKIKIIENVEKQLTTKIK